MSSASPVFPLSTSAYLTLQSLPLLLSPNLITTLLSSAGAPANSNAYYDGPAPHRTTEIEAYLSRALAFALLAYAALLLVLSGWIPVLSPSASEAGDGADDGRNPYHYPAAVVTTGYHAVSAFYLYTQMASFRVSFAMGAGMAVSAGLFCFGMWVVLFDGDQGHIGKRSGTDKRTSGWPFVNSRSSKEIKKRQKEEAEADVRRRSARVNQ